jgi:hypothetical protein
MTDFDDAVEALMEARPESSRQVIVSILEELTPVIADEIERVEVTTKLEDLTSLWKKIEGSASIEKSVKFLIENGVDRMHVIYVYSRFKNSPAVGPSLISWAITKHLKQAEGDKLQRGYPDRE